jgi:glucan 1,3-beta-glucosidase
MVLFHFGFPPLSFESNSCPDRALDTHIYQAWRDPDSRIGFYNDACGTKKILAQMEREFGPVIVGEWSLATDNCAMWLNGFNDNLPGFPRLPCKYIPCADPYMGKGQPGTPVDPTKALQGPYGTGLSGPVFGLCPVGRDWIKESSGNPQTGRDWVKAPPEAPKHADDTDAVMAHLANKKINAFSGVGHGFYFWNFRTDLYEPDWSYMLAMERGWIPKGNLNEDKIQSACEREDDGDFKCILKRNVEDIYVRHAVRYILDVNNQTATDFGQQILSLQGEDLDRQASALIGEYFDDQKAAGATCDFGGVAMLVETNRNITDDDNVLVTDDEYFGGTITVYRGPGTIALVLIVLGATMIGSILGFVFAMRSSKKFNKHVRESKFFRPISQTSLRMVRSSLALPEQESYGELSGLMGRHGKPRT